MQGHEFVPFLLPSTDFIRQALAHVSARRHYTGNQPVPSMNKKLKKQIIMAIMIIVGVFVVFAIVGQIA